MDLPSRTSLQSWEDRRKVVSVAPPTSFSLSRVTVVRKVAQWPGKFIRVYVSTPENTAQMVGLEAALLAIQIRCVHMLINLSEKHATLLY